MSWQSGCVGVWFSTHVQTDQTCGVWKERHNEEVDASG